MEKFNTQQRDPEKRDYAKELASATDPQQFEETLRQWNMELAKYIKD